MKTNVDMIFVKIIVVAIMAVLMLLPINLIQSLIEEREENQQVAQDDINTKWGGVQKLTGPVLVLPYRAGTDKNQAPIIGYAYFLPESYHVEGDVKTEERKRSLFKTLVYQSDLKVSGSFTKPDYTKLNIKDDAVMWNNAFILIGIPYLQGVKNKLVFNVNGQPQMVQPGVKANSVIESGLTVNVALNPHTEEYKFDFNLALNGSDGFYISPIGKETTVHLKSLWNTVSFDGDFLPTNRVIDKNGFDARWDVFDYNRNYVQMWTGTNDQLTGSSLGLEFKFPVDKYQMTMRSVKYAIMFIVLTFVVFFLVELLSKRRIHPVQYLLVSCALVLFYSLLLAISEHLSFSLSYLISASATTILVTAYSSTMFKNLKQTMIMGIFFVGLYTYLYIILQQENMALLFGAVGLFVALAIVMFVLRKVEWYKPKDAETETAKAADTTPIPPSEQEATGRIDE
ncbi:cell envelope integrity protein CreD [Dysgonomonas sp. 511]|uniref:cell envelope integrity protein CreD n=1 Tax=Dysgonomonas sp. 511 TaxID=2302930 RepID=UPI0013D24F27|nr:cell envelope integrity protein CreD [Dysgonomonas sp. 511]NDV77604.1 cell envelope integrity protein CreD [Dysgonomonas sp. 511]